MSAILRGSHAIEHIIHPFLMMTKGGEECTGVKYGKHPGMHLGFSILLKS